MPVNLIKPPWIAAWRTQIKWGLKYIKDNYGTPNGAWKARGK